MRAVDFHVAKIHERLIPTFLVRNGALLFAIRRTRKKLPEERIPIGKELINRATRAAPRWDRARFTDELVGVAHFSERWGPERKTVVNAANDVGQGCQASNHEEGDEDISADPIPAGLGA